MSATAGLNNAASGNQNSDQDRFSKTVGGLKEGMNTAARGLEQAQASIKQGMEQAMSRTEQLMAMGHENFEAVVESGQIMAKGLQTLSRQAALDSQAMMDEALSAMRASISAKSIREFLELNGNLRSMSVDRTFTEFGKMVDSYTRLCQQAWAPLTQRCTRNLERMASAA